MLPEPKEKKTTFRTILISGILVLIPLAITLYVLIFLFNVLDGWLAPAGGQVLRALGFNLPPELNRIPGFGILGTFLLVLLAGLVASNYLGRQILRFGERLIKKIPLVSNIYSSLRQLVDSFSVTGTQAFQSVVLFEFPHSGIWAMGFMTTPAMSSAKKASKQDLVNIFFPTSPIPSQGFMLMIPRNRVHLLSISVEEALKVNATMGIIQNEPVLTPAAQRASGTPKKVARPRTVRTQSRKAK